MHSWESNTNAGLSASDAESATWVVEADDITKSYGVGATSTQVLRSVSLRVRRGECLFLAGPSGSGKSTLLSILGCILSADHGRIKILGKDVANLTATEQSRFRRRHVGFVFQRFHLFRGLNASENVRVALNLSGYPSGTSKARAVEMLDAVGLRDKAQSRITRLSVGQCQRVALARALAAKPDLVLADEPTASLDAQAGLAAMQLLKDLAREQNTTCVVVTHDSRIFHMADRILHLEDGRIVRTQETGT